MSSKVLFISSSLPPNFDSQTIRNHHFIRGLFKAGFTIDTLTVGSEFYNDKDNFNLDVTRNNFITKTPRIKKILSEIKNNIFKSIFHNLYNLIIAPDIYVGWNRLVTKELYDILSKEEYDLIISTSGSYVAHLIASDLCIKLNVKHIADLGDPWADNPIWPENMLHKKVINGYLEKKALSSCSCIITTNANTASLYNAKYPYVNIRNIPMGFIADDVQIERNKDHKNFDINQLINVSYIGVAYKKSRDLTPLIKSISKLNNLKLEIIGPHSKKFEDTANSLKMTNISFRGYIAYSEAERLSRNTDVNIVIGNTGGLQIPGKVYSTIGIAKPILYICQDINDASLDILKDMKGCLISNNEVEQITDKLNYIKDNYGILLSDSIARVSSQAINCFSWDNIGSEFSQCCQKILDSK